MVLSDIGNIDEQEWIKAPQIRPDMNMELDAVVVMPNHFPGIIIIGPNDYNREYGDAMHGVFIHSCSTIFPISDNTIFLWFSDSTESAISPKKHSLLWVQMVTK
jgi:hypothetical protein